VRRRILRAAVPIRFELARRGLRHRIEGRSVATDSVIARFIVDVVDPGDDKPWKVSLVSEKDSERWAQQGFAAPFDLPKLIDASKSAFPAARYPLHPPSEHAKSLEGVAAPLESVRAVYQSIVDRDDPQIEVYGHYLFDALLGGDDPMGGDRWLAMLAHADNVKADVVELALAFHGSSDLGRFHWEMLHTGRDFLAAGVRATDGGSEVRVAITRLVDSDAPANFRALSAPPRVLMVVGSSLTDRSVRPGAELLGLLRRLQDKQRVIDRRLLESAPLTRIKETVKSFDPDVVHIVSHGAERASIPYLELKSRDENQREVTIEAGTETLRNLLHSDGKHPSIVVLSACYTGGSPGSERYVLADTRANVPMAEALVTGGIPIVVGMGGQVTDLTCRLFTRQFGEGVLDGDQLIAAIADARTAVFLDSARVLSKPDWALPALFLDARLPSNFRPVQESADNSAWEQIDAWVAKVELRVDPVFCGRREFVPPFQKLFDRGPGSASAPRVLAVVAQEPHLGGSRLLKELAIQALIDGHIPILVTPEGKEPTDINRLAGLIAAGIQRSRFWNRSLLAGSSWLDLLATRDYDALDPGLARDIRVRGALTPMVLLAAIEHDLLAFREQVESRYSHLRDGLFVFFFDKAEALGDVGIKVLFQGSGSDRLLGQYGLSADDTPVPVVASFTLADGTKELLKDVSESTDGWLVSKELERFDDDQATLAYRWVLLNLQSEFKGLDGKGWVVNPELEDPDEWDAAIRGAFENMPGNLSSQVFLAVAAAAAKVKALAPAEDAQALAKVRGTIG
jgi:CHAT domain-containing protein